MSDQKKKGLKMEPQKCKVDMAPQKKGTFLYKWTLHLQLLVIWEHFVCYLTLKPFIYAIKNEASIVKKEMEDN